MRLYVLSSVLHVFSGLFANISYILKDEQHVVITLKRSEFHVVMSDTISA